MKQQKRKLNGKPAGLFAIALAYLFVPSLFLQTGCHPGIIAVLSTPTSAEMKNKAEYDLTGEKDKKILVLVDQPAAMSACFNMRFLLSDSIRLLLVERLKIEPQQIIDYDVLADFRANTDDYALFSPEKIGRSLGADFVLSVVIIDCQLTDPGKMGHVNGELSASAQLIRAADARRVWPSVEQAKVVKVGFESEKRGSDAATVRLAVHAAHCITRYLYNCPLNQFRISDEVKDIGWESKPASGG